MQIEKEEKNEVNQNLFAKLNQPQQSNKTPSPSLLHSEYLRILPINFSMTEEMMQFWLMSFRQHNFIYHEEQAENKCKFTQSNHPHILDAYVRLGNFQFFLTILIENKKSKQSSETVESCFANIIDCNLLGQKIVVKEISLKKIESETDTIISTIKEYCCLKVCSALHCGPEVKGFLGFDLIIYENCVHFAMEKVIPITKFTETEMKQLQQSLALMHYFQIIHFDIKPPNIAFSPLKKKAVFLDFGLSQIIKEKIGFKTEVSFRGTLNFCSEEMFQLFHKENQVSLIDAYYNDAVCLKTAVEDFLTKAESHQEQPLIFNIYSNEEDSTKNENFTGQQLLCLAKFHLCKEKYQFLVQILPNLSKSEMSSLFEFINQMMVTPSLRVFFSQQLKFLGFREEYRQLENKLSNYCRASIKFRSENISYSQQLQSCRIIKKLSSLSDAIQLKAKGYLAQRVDQTEVAFLELVRMSSTEPVREKCLQLVFELLLNIVNFDKKVNVKMDEKARFAKIFLKNIANISISDEVSSLKCLQNCICYLLDYCLKNSSQWCKKNMLLILLQAIIVDCKIKGALLEIQELLHSICLNVEDTFSLFLELERINNILKFKHRSQNQSELREVKLIALRIKDAAIVKLRDHPNQKISLPLRHILIDLVKQQSVYLSFHQQKDYFRKMTVHLESFRLVSQLQSYFYFLNLSMKFKDNNIHDCFEFIEYLSPYLKRNVFIGQDQIAFGIGFREYYTVMLSAQNISEIKKMTTLIREMFGCQQINDNFQFQMTYFFMSREKDHLKLERYALQILEGNLDPQESSLDLNYLNVWGQIQKDEDFRLHYPQVMQLYIEKIEKVRIINEEEISFTFKQILSDSNLLEIGLEFVSNKPQFIERISMELRERMESCRHVQSRYYYEIKYEIFAAIVHISQNQNSLALLNFQRLYDKFVTYNHIQVPSFCLRNIQIIARSLGQKEQANGRLIDYYKLVRSKSLFAYFIQNDDFIAKTIRAFADAAQTQMLTAFFISTAQFITCYPVKAYFELWIANIVIISGSYPQLFIDATFISQVYRIVSWSNFYLAIYLTFSFSNCQLEGLKWVIVKIDKFIEGFKPYAKMYIMQKYYESVMAKISYSLRKMQYVYMRLTRRFHLSETGQPKMQIKPKFKTFIAKDRKKHKVLKMKLKSFQTDNL